MSNILLIDFGASRIKSIIFDIKSQVSKYRFEIPSPSPVVFTNNQYELDPEDYQKCLMEILDYYKSFVIQEIWICSEMGGFLLTDTNNYPETNYISWKDGRSINDHLLDYLKVYNSDFKDITGMNIKPGLPVINLVSLKKTMDLSEKTYSTLVDWLLLRNGSPIIKSNITLAASSGLVSSDWDSRVLEMFGVDGLKFHEITNDFLSIIGYINDIPVYGGLGDLQAALLGGELCVDSGIINLGTGSQVVCMGENINEETRPYLNAKVSVITHIPCGRALNVFVDVLGHAYFWDVWKTLDSEEILASSIKVDLSIFSSAWDSSGKFGFIELREGVNFREYIAGIAKAWVSQYVKALNLLDIDSHVKNVYLTGGMVSKSPFLVENIKNIDGFRDYRIIKTITGEETLDGLLFLAQEKHRV